jgi:hypothetical protein
MAKTVKIKRKKYKVNDERLSGSAGDTLTQPPAPLPPYVPPAPTAQAMPYDAGYEGQVNANQLGYDNTMSNALYQEGRVGENYGFDQYGNRTDALNPYNQARMLERAYQQGQRGITNSAASAGQLYSGSRIASLNEGTFRYNRDLDTTQRAAMDAYNQVAQDRKNAEFDLATGNADAYAGYLERSLAKGATDPGVLSEAEKRGVLVNGKIDQTRFASEWAKDLEKLRKRQLKNKRNRR